jgi:hypothetical protein
MSSTPAQTALPPAPQTYAGTGSIDLGRIEEELAALWRQAGEAAVGSGQVLTRACLWNLVECHPIDAAPSGSRADPVDDVCAIVPSRLIRLRAEAVPAGAALQREVDAWVSTRCNLSAGGGHQICTEEIQVVGHGASSQSHFPALVRAMLVPDLPVALVWLDHPPHKGRLLRDLLRLCDRILIDSQPRGDAQMLAGLNGLVEETHAYFVDLGWMRLTPVRYMIASLFDAPGRAGQLKRVDGIRVEATPAGRNTGLLLLGWVLSRLGKVQLKADESPGRGSAYRWKANLGARSFPVEFVVEEGEGGYDGVHLLDVSSGGDHFSMRQTDPLHVELNGPEHDRRRLALHGWNDAELLVAGLGAHGIDALYPQALKMAGTLIEAEAWNR